MHACGHDFHTANLLGVAEILKQLESNFSGKVLLLFQPAEEKIPVYQLADYLSTECSDIWALQGKSTETNPLYWLRAMDCADRLMPAQSRQQARQ